MENEGDQINVINKRNENENNTFNQDNLYTKQKEEIIKHYNEKRSKIKMSFDIMYERYQQSQEFYEQFLNLIKDYKEIKLNNIVNMSNLLNKYLNDDDKNNNKSENIQMETIKKEFKNIITSQINAEKEKINQINQLYLDEDKLKNIEEDLNNSKKLLNDLNNLYSSYINSINDIEKKHLSYLQYFNEYEKTLVDLVYKNIKNSKIYNNINKQKNNINEQNNNNPNEHNNDNNNDNENELYNNNNNKNEPSNNIKKEENKNGIDIKDFIYDENEQIEFNEMTHKLMKKEKKYKKYLKIYDESIHPQYLEFKKCIDDLSSYHNDFYEQENQLFTFVYLGYIISIEKQLNYQKRELSFENLSTVNYQNYNELNQLFESIPFEQYKTVFLSSNVDNYNWRKEIPSEVIIKLSYILHYYFPYIPKLKKIDFEEPKIKFISVLIQKLFNDDFISESEENNIINDLKKNKYRLIFLKYLNTFRSKGKFVLSGKSIIILGNIIRTITDLYDIRNNNYDVLNLLIILCQTYYTINKKKKKIYLFRFIEDHPLFQTEEIWEYFIEESIKKEIREKEKNSKEEDLLLDEETKMAKKCNVYFSVLLSTTQNILEFQIDKDIIKKIMVNLIDKKYNITPTYIEQILSLIEDTVYEKKKHFNINIDILGKNK